MELHPCSTPGGFSHILVIPTLWLQLEPELVIIIPTAVDIDLSSQRRETTPFCYGPVLAEALLSAVPSHSLAGGLLMPIGTNLQPVQSHYLATCQPSECPRTDLD